MRANSLTPPRGRAVPLYFTTSYVFDDSATQPLFNLEMPGHLYSRHQPDGRCSSVSQRSKVGLGRLHGERSGGLLSQGRHPDGPGGHIVASRNIYGGTHQMLNVTLPRLGSPPPSSIRETRRPSRTPSPTRPASSSRRLSATPVEVLDIPAVAEVAHRHRLPLMVDSTFRRPTASVRSSTGLTS